MRGDARGELGSDVVPRLDLHAAAGATVRDGEEVDAADVRHGAERRGERFRWRRSLDVHPRGGAEAIGETRGAIRREHPTAVQDDDAVAHRLHLGECVARDQDGVLAGQQADEAAGLGALLGVEACRRFVEEVINRGNFAVINAKVPLINMFGYANDVRLMSEGRATFTMQFDHYAPAPSPEDLRTAIVGRWCAASVMSSRGATRGCKTWHDPLAPTRCQQTSEGRE